MGSSSSHLGPTLAAAVCGLLFLIFDAGRYFAQQLGPVGLRALAGDSEEDQSRNSGWTRFDPLNLQLVSGSLLQIALALAVVFTAVIFNQYSIAGAGLIAIAIWIPILIVWKFVLALVPEDASGMMLRAIVPVSHFFYLVFWPVLYPLRNAVARREAAEELQEEYDEPTDEVVQAYIEVGEEEGILEPSEGRLLQSIVDFGDRVAREIMTPRIDMVAVDASLPIEEVARIFSESKYARIPIYRETIDQVIGVVHIKDVLDVLLRREQRPLADLARQAYVVSETKSVAELLREFQSEHLQLAIVVDEYGGTAGLVTIEDIIEEIVGEIADEHEEEEPTIVELDDKAYLVSGLLRVEQLEGRLNADLSADNYETVAGLIFTTLGRVPNVGAVVTKNGYRFEVDRADRRRIYRVRVSPDPEWGKEEESEE